MSGIIFPHNGLIKTKAGGWTPAQLANSIWWDASDTTTMLNDALGTPSNSDTIEQWTSKGSNSNNPYTLTNTTSAQQPTWNSQGYVSFLNTSSQRLTCGPLLSATGMFNSGPNVSIYALMKTPATAANEVIVGESNQTDSSVAYLILRRSGAANTIRAYLRSQTGNGDAPACPLMNGNSFDNTWNRVGMEMTDQDLATGRMQNFLEGVSQTDSAYTWPVGVMDATLFAVGGYIDGSPANFQTGDIAQLVITPNEISANAADLAALDAFFVEKLALIS